MSLLFLLCSGDLRNVFDGYALTGIGFYVVPVLRQFGQFNILSNLHLSVRQRNQEIIVYCKVYAFL